MAVPTVARISLTIAILFWVFGNIVLCWCPEIFFTSAIVTAVAIWAGTGKVRKYSWITFVAALLLAGIHLARVMKL